MEKPYTNIEHLDKDTIREEKPLWMYVLSKIIPQSRVLEGEQEYGLFVCIHAPHGIQYAVVTVDGAKTGLTIPYGSVFLTHDFVGVKTPGRHKYELDVIDYQGKKGYSQCYMTIVAGTKK